MYKGVSKTNILVLEMCSELRISLQFCGLRNVPLGTLMKLNIDFQRISLLGWDKIGYTKSSTSRDYELVAKATKS